MLLDDALTSSSSHHDLLLVPETDTGLSWESHSLWARENHLLPICGLLLLLSWYFFFSLPPLGSFPHFPGKIPHIDFGTDVILSSTSQEELMA